MKKRVKILTTTSTFASVDKTPLERLVAAGCEVIVNPYKRKLTEDELMGLLPEVKGIIAGLETITRKALQNSSLEVISRCGSGMDNVDLKAAKEFGIKVFRTPNAPVNSVAELTIAGMLSLVRHLNRMDRALHHGTWQKETGFNLEGKVVAIIGFGRIGQRVAELLKAFKAVVIAVDPACLGTCEGISIFTLEEALKKADIITLHVSGGAQIIGRNEFNLMKKDVFILNCARGGVIDEKELCASLDVGHVAGAYVDCFSVEPYQGPLSSYPQVILSPHAGSYTRQCRLSMEMEAVDNLLKGLALESLS